MIYKTIVSFLTLLANIQGKHIVTKKVQQPFIEKANLMLSLNKELQTQ